MYMHRACVHVLKINAAGETIYLFVFALISARATFEFELVGQVTEGWLDGGQHCTNNVPLIS